MMNKPVNRRSFIKETAAISAFTLLNPTKIFGTQVNSSVRIGIIGVGNRGLGVLGRAAAIRQELVTWDEIYFSSAKMDPHLNGSQFNE